MEYQASMSERKYKPKATRIEYTAALERFFKTNTSFERNKLLEISGNTEVIQKHFSNCTSTTFPEIDCEDLPYEDNTYDCVVMFQVLEHTKRPWLCVEETYRVLKPGGIAIFSAPFIYQVHDWPGDYFRFTIDGLISMAESAGYNERVWTHKAGNDLMIKHMIDNPDDRRSPKFISLAKKFKRKKDLYYLISTVIMRK